MNETSTVKDVTVGIVDDEPLSRNGMHKLAAATPGFRVVGEAASGVEALALIRQRSPEILLLDVHMPGFDGFTVLRHLGDGPRPTIVFVTAHDEHALQAFNVHAVDYLLKPYTDERFREALHVARRVHRSREHAAHVDRLEALVRTLATDRARSDDPEAPTISIRTRGRIEVISLSDIAWIEADGSYVRLHTAGRSRIHRESLAMIAKRFGPAHFVRAHRSALVARSAVREVIRTKSGVRYLALTTGDRVRLSRQGWVTVSAVLNERR